MINSYFEYIIFRCLYKLKLNVCVKKYLIQGHLNDCFNVKKYSTKTYYYNGLQIRSTL